MVTGQYLKQVPLLAKVGDEERNGMGASMKMLAFNKDSFIFKQGDEADGFFIIKQGQATVIHSDEKGCISDPCCLQIQRVPTATQRSLQS